MEQYPVHFTSARHLRYLHKRAHRCTCLHVCTLSLSFSLPLSLTHTHRHTHSLSHTHTHALTVINKDTTPCLAAGRHSVEWDCRQNVIVASTSLFAVKSIFLYWHFDGTPRCSFAVLITDENKALFFSFN